MNIFKALKRQVSVKNMVHQRLAGYEPARPHFPLRASDLMSELEFCPREHIFMDLGMVKKKDQFIGTAQVMTFAHGRDMEHRMRNEWLRDVAVGNWTCGVCSKDFKGFGKAPLVACQSCGWNRWVYKEPRFDSPLSKISGGFDMLVDVGAAKLRILEVKSIDKDAFSKLLAPMAEHKFRTSLYLTLAHESVSDESKRVDTSEASILYVSKAFGVSDPSLKAAGIKDSPFSPMKEFVVKRDEALVATPVNKAKVLAKAREDKSAGMPCQICPNGLTKRAQNCPAVGYCFSGSYPSNLTWLENGVPKHPGKTIVN